MSFLKIRRKKEDLPSKSLIKTTISEEPSKQQNKTTYKKQFEAVCKNFEILNIPSEEIKKLSKSEIITLGQALIDSQDFLWGKDKSDAFILSKEKLENWGNYNIYYVKILHPHPRQKNTKISQNKISIQNFLFVCENEKIIGHILLHNNAKPNLSNVKSLVVRINPLWESSRTNINETLIQNGYYETTNSYHYSLLSKKGKLIYLYEPHTLGSAKYKINKNFLTANDTIIKNELCPISRLYQIKNNTKMEAKTNWKVDGSDFELTGINLTEQGPDFDHDEFNLKLAPTFSILKNYSNLANISNNNKNNFEYIKNSAYSNKHSNSKIHNITLTPKGIEVIISINSLIRKKEILNAYGEVITTKFFDKDSYEVTSETKQNKEEKNK